jgi:hypothetical protein
MYRRLLTAHWEAVYRVVVVRRENRGIERDIGTSCLNDAVTLSPVVGS